MPTPFLWVNLGLAPVSLPKSRSTPTPLLRREQNVRIAGKTLDGQGRFVLPPL